MRGNHLVLEYGANVIVNIVPKLNEEQDVYEDLDNEERKYIKAECDIRAFVRDGQCPVDVETALERKQLKRKCKPYSYDCTTGSIVYQRYGIITSMVIHYNRLLIPDLLVNLQNLHNV